jgi:hypothetical protein
MSLPSEQTAVKGLTRPTFFSYWANRSRFPKAIQGLPGSTSAIQGYPTLFKVFWGGNYLFFPSPAQARWRFPMRSKPFQGFFQKKKIVYIPTTASVTSPSSGQKKAGKR